MNCRGNSSPQFDIEGAFNGKKAGGVSWANVCVPLSSVLVPIFASVSTKVLIASLRWRDRRRRPLLDDCEVLLKVGLGMSSSST